MPTQVSDFTDDFRFLTPSPKHHSAFAVSLNTHITALHIIITRESRDEKRRACAKAQLSNDVVIATTRIRSLPLSDSSVKGPKTMSRNIYCLNTFSDENTTKQPQEKFLLYC